MLSFFNQFGVCELVQKCFMDIFLKHSENLLSSQNIYSKCDKGMERVKYNYYIEQFASEFVSKLFFYIPLLREPVLSLIKQISEYDENNILSIYFIFDSLISDQLSEAFEFCNIYENNMEKNFCFWQYNV